MYLIALVPGFGIYFYILYSLEAITTSSIFGWLAFSIAVGSMFFFGIVSPYGKKQNGKFFGFSYKYKTPVSIIPNFIFNKLLIAVLSCCIISFMCLIFQA